MNKQHIGHFQLKHKKNNSSKKSSRNIQITNEKNFQKKKGFKTFKLLMGPNMI
jgi:hypothetical protein